MTSPSPTTLSQAQVQLSDRSVTAYGLAKACIDRIADPEGQGHRAFVEHSATAVLENALTQDKLRAQGLEASPWAGLPISIKDNIDVRGQKTRAGSKALDHLPAAEQDAPAVFRLRQAGFVLTGRTHMPELALSGLGPDPRMPVPLNPWDRSTGRVPGGSSSGAAVSVADGMSLGAIGSDTGGSCRIPAAYCGITGYRPSATSLPQTGMVPLSTTLDSMGCLAHTALDCAILWSVMAQKPLPKPKHCHWGGLRLLIPSAGAMGELDPAVAADFERTIAALRQLGVTLEVAELPALADMPKMHRQGGFIPPESLSWHRRFWPDRRPFYGERVLGLIDAGQNMGAADYLDLQKERQAFVDRMHQSMDGFDAMLMPTAANVPPRIADLADAPTFHREQFKALRNPTIANWMDACSISMPMHLTGAAPTGLMLTAPQGQDAELLGWAQSLQTALQAIKDAATRSPSRRAELPSA